MATQSAFVYYVQSNRLDYELSFSAMGGVSIEEHWDQLSSIKVDAAVDVSHSGLQFTAGADLFLQVIQFCTVLALCMQKKCRALQLFSSACE